MICPSCNRPATAIKSVIAQGAIKTGCSACLVTVVKGTDLAAQGHRKQDQRQFAQDLVQPFEHGYAKLYGEENARSHGWDTESLRKHG